MKDKSLHKVVEHLYVYDFLNLIEVAKRIGVNERTIRRWRDNNDWLAKRRDFINQHSNIHDDLYNLACYTFEKIKEDMENGNNINPGRMNQMINLFEAMLKSYKTEKLLAKYGKHHCKQSAVINFDEKTVMNFLKMLE